MLVNVFQKKLFVLLAVGVLLVVFTLDTLTCGVHSLVRLKPRLQTRFL